MKIAIHQRKGGFSEHWVAYCKQHEIPFKIVNCYDNDIIQQLNDCDALMWHHHHQNYKDVLFAKELLYALEFSGLKVFPNFNTSWHFDDKVGQKYLLEALNLPLVPSHVFYDKKSALNWIASTSFPKVFKLRGGAGATNVKLTKNKKEAEKKVNIAFGRGFSQYDRIGRFKDTFNKLRNGKTNFSNALRAAGRLFIPTTIAKMGSREKGYVYFQEFIPSNDCDYRVIIINNKAIAVKRMTRKNDFRASGSGEFYYDKDNFDDTLIETAFQALEKLGTQSCAFDFVYDQYKKPLIVEISYGFASSGYDACPGYWDQNLDFHKSKIDPYGWMVEELINSI